MLLIGCLYLFVAFGAVELSPQRLRQKSSFDDSTKELLLVHAVGFLVFIHKYSVIEDGVWSSGAGEFDRFFFLLCIQTFNRKIEGDQSLISNFKIGTLYLKLIVSITLCREDTKLIVYVIGKSLTCLTPMFVSIEKQPQFLDIKIFFFLFIELNDHRTDRDEIFIHINS